MVPLWMQCSGKCRAIAIASTAERRCCGVDPVAINTDSFITCIIDSKVVVRLQPVGLTPPTLPRVFKLGRDQLVATVSQFIVKRLRLDLGPFLYLQSSFQVNPDDNIGQLYELYRTGDELIFSYCTTAAFG